MHVSENNFKYQCFLFNLERERERNGGVNMVFNRLWGSLCEVITKVCGHVPVVYFKLCLVSSACGYKSTEIDP